MSKRVRDLIALAILVVAISLIVLSLIEKQAVQNGARLTAEPPAVTGGKPFYTKGGYYCVVPLEGSHGGS